MVQVKEQEQTREEGAVKIQSPKVKENEEGNNRINSTIFAKSRH